MTSTIGVKKIQYPNGTDILTLDSSGSLSIDTNTLHVDASNNRVGIGTTSPSQALHVAGGNPAGHLAHFCNLKIRVVPELIDLGMPFMILL